jgi:hypothetical protein
MQQSKRTLQLQAIDLRRARVLELLSTGYTTSREIASKLNLDDHTTVYRDIKYLMNVSNIEIRNHFKSLPLEIKKCNMGLDLTIRALTRIIDSDATEPAHRLGALTARMQAYRFKMEILDGQVQLDEVFAYIDQQKQQEDKKQAGFNGSKW